MADYDSDELSPVESRFSLRSLLLRDWPYLLMLALALFGVAYTNFARASMTGYWAALAPLFGIICVAARWRAVKDNQSHLRLIWTQALHWGAVVFSMYLVFEADVQQMMSDFASSLMVLTVLALGTFTAGIHIGSWRVCLAGIVLGLGVPAIAWFEERSFLLVLLFILLLAGAAVFYVLNRRRSRMADSF